MEIRWCRNRSHVFLSEAITAVDQIGDGHEMGLVSTFEIGVSEAVILGAVRQSMLVEKIDNGMTRLVSWWPLPHVRGPLSRGLKPRVRPAMVANGSPLALEIRI